MPTERIAFPGHGGDELAGSFFVPDEPLGDGQAVVLVHEVFGLDPATEDVARRLATAGYHVLAPDLYGREGTPGPAPTEADPAPEWTLDQIRAASSGVPDRRALADLDGAAGWLAQHEDVDARSVAIVGFCMGGTLAFLAGCTSTRFACVVDFYGRVLYGDLSEIKPVQPIEMLLNLDRPLLALFGEEDASIPLDDVRLLEKHLSDANKDFELVTYPGAGHGFFNARRARHHQASADDAWARTLRFLEERL